jgi:hypothetical protein
VRELVGQDDDALFGGPEAGHVGEEDRGTQYPARHRRADITAPEQLRGTPQAERRADPIGVVPPCRIGHALRRPRKPAHAAKRQQERTRSGGRPGEPGHQQERTGTRPDTNLW